MKSTCAIPTTLSYTVILERSRSYHDALQEHARKTRNPILFLNYERAVQNEASKLQTAREVAAFLGADASEENVERAVSMITGDGKGYVNLPEHFFLASAEEKFERGAEIELEQFGVEGWKPMDMLSHENQKPLVKFRIAGEQQQNLPKKFWLKLDFKSGKNVKLAEDPIRLFFNFTGEYFAGHCTRPKLIDGENWICVETSGNAADFAFGPLSIPMTFSLSPTIYAAA